MHAFDFLNVRRLVEIALKDKRKGNNKTAYRRFMELKRGLSPTIEKHELEAFYDQYKEDDKTFKSYIENLIKTAKS